LEIEENSPETKKNLAYFKLAFLLYLTYFTYVVITGKLETIDAFIHNVDLPIHEFGHLLFGIIFGGLMTYAGGNLFQFIFPCILAGSFFFRKDYFGSAICVLWAGETLIDASYYISDARSRDLPLITGDIDSHDWFNFLGGLDILQYDTIIGKIVFFFGALFMLGGLIFAFYEANKDGKFIERS
jgi:hypothetical protein